MGPGQHGVCAWFRHLGRKCLLHCYYTALYPMWNVRKLYPRKFTAYQGIAFKDVRQNIRILSVFTCPYWSLSTYAFHKTGKFHKKTCFQTYMWIYKRSLRADNLANTGRILLWADNLAYISESNTLIYRKVKPELFTAPQNKIAP